MWATEKHELNNAVGMNNLVMHFQNNKPVSGICAAEYIRLSHSHYIPYVCSA